MLNAIGEVLVATGQPGLARPNFEAALTIAMAITLRGEQARAMAGLAQEAR